MKSKTLATAALVVSLNERKRAEQQAPKAAGEAVSAALAQIQPRIEELRADLEAARRDHERAETEFRRALDALQQGSTDVLLKVDAHAVEFPRALSAALAGLRDEVSAARNELDVSLRRQIASGDEANAESIAAAQARLDAAAKRLEAHVAEVTDQIAQVRAENLSEIEAAAARLVAAIPAPISTSDMAEAARAALVEMQGEFQGEQGRPGIVWRGPWRADREYAPGDGVSNMGSSWIAVEPSFGKRPTAGSRYWDVLARAGVDGGGGGRRAEALAPGETTVLRVRYPTGQTQVTVEAVKAAPVVQCYLTTFADESELEIESEAAASLAYRYFPAQQRMVVDTLPQFAGLLVLTF